MVLGGRFGGYVALAYAGLYPDHPGGVILCHATEGRSDQLARHRGVRPPRRPPGSRRRAARLADKTGDYQAEFTRVCYPLYSATPGWPRESRQFLARMMNMDVSLHYASQLASGLDPWSVTGAVRCPVLVLAGEDDPVCPLPVVEELVAGCQRSLPAW